MPRFAPVRQIRRVRFHKHITQDRLSVNGARNAIKRWAAEAGAAGFISGHSLRVGSAVSLVQAGASVVEMQTAGRWADPKIFAVKALCFPFPS